jgi:hypothetical protein
LCQPARIFAAIVAEHVELALFEQSLGNIEGLHRPSVIAWLTLRRKPQDQFFSMFVSTAIAAFSGLPRLGIASPAQQ